MTAADPPAWAMVLESRGSGDIAFGPVVALDSPDCLDCIGQRRRASQTVPGNLSLHPLSPADYARVKDTRFRSHQIHADTGAQRFIVPNGCRNRCASKLWPQSAPLPVEDCVGDRLGLVRELSVLEPITGTYTAIALGAATVGSAGVPTLCAGTATASTRERACRLALYEALERYAAAFWAPEDLHYSDAGNEAEGPWVNMRLLDSDASTRVLAARVYMPFRDSQGRWSGTSEGLACGDSVDDALGRAVAEVIERRAVTALLAQAADAADAADAAPAAPAALAAPANRVGPIAAAGECTRAIAHCDGHVVAVSAAWSTAPPYVVTGFGCARNAQQAGDKARRERVHILAHQLLAQQGYWGTPPAPSSALDLALARLANEAGFAAGFLTCLQQGVPGATAGGAGRIAWRDLTPPDLVPFGLHVVRALSLDT